MSQHIKHESNAQRQAAYRQSTAEARLLQLSTRGLPPLPTIPTMPGEKRWLAGLLQTSVLLENIHSEMQGYYDDRSERWKESERGELHEERLQMLEHVLENIQDLLER